MGWNHQPEITLDIPSIGPSWKVELFVYRRRITFGRFQGGKPDGSLGPTLFESCIFEGWSCIWIVSQKIFLWGKLSLRVSCVWFCFSNGVVLRDDTRWIHSKIVGSHGDLIENGMGMICSEIFLWWKWQTLLACKISQGKWFHITEKAKSQWTYMCLLGLNSHCFHRIGDKLINPIP